MREIKFRAWDREENVMAYGIGLNLEYFVNENQGKYEILQYTGLKDKNGKEIYEGDIVKYDDTEDMSHWCAGEIALIVFNPARFSGRMKPYDRFTGTNQNMLTDDFEDCTTIIGNIYENPELIK